MALVRRVDRGSKDSTRVHDEVECTYTIVSDYGDKLLQLDTYGKRDRQDAGKVSRSIQLDRGAALALKALIERTFGAGNSKP